MLIISTLVAQKANYQNTHNLQMWKYFLLYKFKLLFNWEISACEF